ncbi:MAG TPA: hypothetical protein VMT18_08220, partial [Planctomycetota bacterium]|nr:hypothetical protein [Planctomycetota bacterium]
PDGGTIYAHWALGVCDDGRGNLVLLEDLGSLLVIDLPEGVSTMAAVQGGQQLGAPRYTLALSHDGETARSFVNGEPCKELRAATRSAGDVIFSVHSDTQLLVEELVVEGELDEERARARWIERKLAALGL